MKPSERIEQISKENERNLFVSMNYGVTQYLDEEKERVNEVLHEIVNTVYESRGDFSEKRMKELHKKIDELSNPNSTE